MEIILTKKGIVLLPYGEADELKLNTLSDAIYQVDIKTLDTRTIKQNRALHLWCKQIAEVLNKQEIYLQSPIFKDSHEWTMLTVKEHLIKPTIKILGISSTTQLKKKDIDALIDVVTRGLARQGIETPNFPKGIK